MIVTIYEGDKQRWVGDISVFFTNNPEIPQSEQHRVLDLEPGASRDLGHGFRVTREECRPVVEVPVIPRDESDRMREEEQEEWDEHWLDYWGDEKRWRALSEDGQTEIRKTFTAIFVRGWKVAMKEAELKTTAEFTRGWRLGKKEAEAELAALRKEFEATR